MYPTKQYRIGSISTSEKEIRDLLKAWIAISLAFGILLSGTISFPTIFIMFILSALTVGIAFLLHELSHKIIAQSYGCFAEFRSFDSMLILAIIMSFLGFIFAAPGAVMISGPVGRRRNGKISLAGPLSNIILAFLFLIPFLLLSNSFLRGFCFIGLFINSLLAAFNILPFWNFDGKKILAWNKGVYGLITATAIIIFSVSYFFYSKADFSLTSFFGG